MAWIVMAVASLGTSTLRAAPALHVIIAADTNDPNIGDSVRVDVGWMKQVVEANVPAGLLRQTILEGDQVTDENLLGSIQGLRVDPEKDSVLFYYSGHGQHDRQQGHLLVTRDWQLERRKIRDTIMGLRPRVGAVITDTCSNFRSMPAPAPFAPPTDRVSPLFQALFFDTRGLVDISATAPGEFALGTSNGGVFTFALFRVLTEDPEKRMSWASVVRRTNQLVAEDSGTLLLRGLTVRQTATALTPLPGGGGGEEGPPPRLGVVAERTRLARQWGGLQITQVLPDSPATRILGPDGKRYTLAPQRDIILRVNQQRVSTSDELAAAVAGAGSSLVLTVHDLSTGRSDDYRVDLSSRPRRVLGIAGFATNLPDGQPGVAISGVDPDTPATRIQDDRGITYTLAADRDVITHVDGERVRTVSELAAALDRSSGECRITVHDLQVGSTADYRVRFSP